jgi:predicted transcriptional regulator
MTTNTKMKSTSLRLPDDLLQATQALAARRSVSMNALVVNSIERTLRDDEESALYEAFTLLGQDEDAEVEFAIAAQSEVVARGKR